MSLNLPVLQTERLVTRLASHRDVPAIVRYYRQNQAFLTPFEPARPDYFYTDRFWQEQVERNLIEFNYRQSLRLFVFDAFDNQEILGVINFTQFVEGISYFCYLGYSLAETAQGQGYMTEALGVATRYVFDQMNMHRIMANYMPHNQRSGNLLRRLGFVVEGYARDYLLIDGKWRDHILTSLINPQWRGEISP